MQTRYINIASVNSVLKIAATKDGGKCHLIDFNILIASEYPLEERDSYKGILAFSKEESLELDERFEWYELDELESFANGDGALVCEALGKLWSFMPNSLPENDLEDITLPKEIYKLKGNPSKEHLAFFGGSFNPWHVGHTECVEQCPNANLIVVPDANPWKQRESEGCAFKSFMDIVQTLSETPYSIYPGFWGMSKSNPTVDWIGEVKCTKKSLLIGDDNFISFLKWTRVETLVELLDSIYCVPRNHKIDELYAVRDELEKLNSNLKVEFLNEHAYQDVSSTQIRETRKGFEL